MNLLKHSALGILAGAVIAFGFHSSADAQFYKGKRVNIIINYSPGGNTDIQGRMVMRYMKKFIPGNPRLVFRHVSGAAGSVGANFLADVGKTNGSMMGIFTIPIMFQVMKDPSLRADLANDFVFVGSIAQQTISHIRVDSIPGKKITSYKDVLFEKEHKIRTGGHGPQSSKDMRTRLFFTALKIPHQPITGYKSGGKMRAALHKGEIDMTADSLAGYFGRVVPQLIKPGTSIPVWHIGRPTADGDIVHASSVPKDIPSFKKVYEEKFGKGKRPPRLVWEAISTIAGTREMLRIIVFKKGTNKKAVSAMRTAWAKTIKDPDFRKEYKRVNGSEFGGMNGVESGKYIKRLLNVKPELQKFLFDFARSHPIYKK